jgi:ketosteroid isomerase-like protein
MSAEQERRARNTEIFRTMLGHLGRQEYAQCGQYLTEDVYADWPYIPAPGCPDHIVGRAPLLAFFQGGMDGFEPYSYRISAIHEMLNPDHLIAEYSSHSRFRDNGRPYSNRYCAIVHFKDDLIAYWREYVNPETIRIAMT